MNNVSIIGRLTRDPELHSAEGKTSVARFSVAIDRGKDKDGNDRGADFPNIVCFGKTAELVGKYFSKGKLIGITGRIQTGNYEKDGKKVYTTDVLAERIDFLSPRSSSSSAEPSDDVPAGFEQLDPDEIPF